MKGLGPLLFFLFICWMLVQASGGLNGSGVPAASNPAGGTVIVTNQNGHVDPGESGCGGVNGPVC